MKDEKRLLAQFSDSQMNIDPKFKRQLRSKITVGSKKPRVWAWPRLVMVPAMIMLVLLVAVFVSIPKSSQGNNPFRPQKVSAAELIEKSDEVKQSLLSDKYNYWYEQSINKAGPKSTACSPYSESDSTFTTYEYSNKEDKVEALYSTYETDGHSYISQQVYNDSGKDVLANTKPFVAQSLSYWLKIASEGPKGEAGEITNDMFLLEKGKLVRTDTIPRTTINNKHVYAFYVKPKKDSDMGMPCQQRMIQKLVIDASNYQLLESSMYLDNLSDDNLVGQYLHKIEAKKLDTPTALRYMKAAGFDKNHATDMVTSKGGI